MDNIIKLIVMIVNLLHDFIMSLTDSLGYNLTDKDLHFWVIGFIGIFIFMITQIAFKVISNWSITAISFIYTFTVLVVIVFAIEIEQKITGSGHMEFADIAVGLYGFFMLFFVYLLIKLIINFIKKSIFKKNNSK
ncbi:hypothetical protein ABES02_10180 [Neobacillus pocheonensis]|uniref:hypothetical protein n=1 Tax=Neobacillus pocheonensis TaxID=363869 RepID=UPI003D2D5114